ncbi:MAG: chemotaxis protein CheA, partial [Nitrospirae bacterium]|nr:chemotaxis protein CheA [Nitrospirota bacterium]
MIEDKELRELFKAESEEHLGNLDKGLLHIEKNPHDLESLKELFREAHSLKGAARMLEVNSVEIIAHRFEDLLGCASRGEKTITLHEIERMNGGLSILRKLVHEAVTGERADIDVPRYIKELDNQVAEDDKTAIQTQAAPVIDIAKPIEQIPKVDAVKEVLTPIVKEEVIKPNVVQSIEPKQPPKAIVEEDKPVEESKLIKPLLKPNKYQIDTIRVGTGRLDLLMTQAGELAVTVKRLEQLTTDIDNILELFELWSKDEYTQSSIVRDVEGKFDDPRIKRLLNFQRIQNSHLEQLKSLVKVMKNTSNENSSRLGTVATELHEGIRTIRLLPLSTIFSLFPRMVRDLAKNLNKEVEFIVEGAETTADKHLLEEMKDPLMHIIRNALDHGIEMPMDRIKLGKQKAGTLLVKANQSANYIIIEIIDDGKGLDIEAIKRTAVKKRICRKEELLEMTIPQIQNLIFSSGLSTSEMVTDVSGRGIGLDVVKNNVERLKGQISIESTAGKGCTISVKLPITLSTTRVFLVSSNHMKFAIPIEFVLFAKNISHSDIFSIEGRETIIIDDHPVSVGLLSDLLELKVLKLSEPETITQRNTLAMHDNKPQAAMVPCIILAVGAERLGVLVDAIIDEQEVVFKPHTPLLKRVRNISGATILGDGEVCMIVNPHDLIRTVRKQHIASEDLQNDSVET